MLISAIILVGIADGIYRWKVRPIVRRQLGMIA